MSDPETIKFIAVAMVALCVLTLYGLYRLLFCNPYGPIDLTPKDPKAVTSHANPFRYIVVLGVFLVFWLIYTLGAYVLKGG